MTSHWPVAVSVSSTEFLFRSVHYAAKNPSEVKYTDIAVRSLTCHTAIGTQLPCRITQCYLPPDRGDISAFTPAEAGTRLSNPGGMT